MNQVPVRGAFIRTRYDRFYQLALLLRAVGDVLLLMSPLVVRTNGGEYMNKVRLKTAAQWLVELLAREALRAALHWVLNLLKQDG